MSRRPSCRGVAARLVASAFVVGAVLVTRIPTAGAHAALVRSAPAASATVADAPPTVRLWFQEAVASEATAVEMTTADGDRVPIRLDDDPGQADLVVAHLPMSLPDGVYVVRWQVLSDADGHLARGVLAFGVGAGTDPSAAAPGPASRVAQPGDVLLRWLGFLTLAGLVGPLVVALGPLGGRRCRALAGAEVDVLRCRAQARLVGAAAVAGGLALIVGVAIAAHQVRSLTDGPAGQVAAASDVVFGTRWGTLWLARQLAVLVATGCLLSLRRCLHGSSAPVEVRRWAGGAAMAAAALVVVQALGGHAAAGDAPAPAVAADAAHLAGAACWTGGLVALVALGRPGRSGPGGRLALAAWQAFGPIAAACVGVLVTTGVYGMGRQVVTLDAALTTTYGRALLAKSVLLVAMGLAGLSVSVALHPTLARALGVLVARGRAAARAAIPSGSAGSAGSAGRGTDAVARVAEARPKRWPPVGGSLRRLVIVEAGLGIAVLLLAALATASPPANGPELQPAAATAPGTRSAPAGDLLVSLSAHPNRSGENLLRVRATSTRRQAPDEIDRVLVRLAPGTGDGQVETVSLLVTPDGTYEASTTVLDRPGAWQAEVVVRRAGIEDATAAFDWEVPATAPPPRLVSNRPWRAALDTAAAVLAVALVTGCAAALGFTARRRAVLSATDAAHPVPAADEPRAAGPPTIAGANVPRAVGPPRVPARSTAGGTR